MLGKIVSIFRKNARTGWVDLTGAFSNEKKQKGNVVFFEQ